jgi:hypothetical protein
VLCHEESADLVQSGLSLKRSRNKIEANVCLSSKRQTWSSVLQQFVANANIKKYYPSQRHGASLSASSSY